jgi:glycosyltransferase involved in cell wall biosynthesis
MMKKNFISILITNYNKEKFLNSSLKSVLQQNYSNFEILLFDDFSTDGSLRIIKKFKKIKLFQNEKKKSIYAPLNQLNGIIYLYKKSKGNIICLMDADDQFLSKKIEYVSKKFDKEKETKCIFNLIKNKQNQFKYKIKANNSIWPSIFPTSCISMRRPFFKEFSKYNKENFLPHLEIDARLTIFSKFYFNQYNILNKKLTKYNLDTNGITFKIKKYSKGWWLRRYEAFEYLRFILKLKNKKFSVSLDYYLTYILANILKVF